MPRVLLTDPIDASGEELLRARAVTIHGTGVDLVPLAAASARGVLVANLPGSNAQSVAEYCVLAMLMLARNRRRDAAPARRREAEKPRQPGGLACPPT